MVRGTALLKGGLGNSSLMSKITYKLPFCFGDRVLYAASRTQTWYIVEDDLELLFPASTRLNLCGGRDQTQDFERARQIFR